MTGFAPLLRKELLEQWRTTRLPVVATVFLLVGLSSPLLARFTPEIIKAVGGDQFQIVLPTPTAADAYDQLAKNLGQFGALIAILLAMGSVATDVLGGHVLSDAELKDLIRTLEEEENERVVAALRALVRALRAPDARLLALAEEHPVPGGPDRGSGIAAPGAGRRHDRPRRFSIRARQGRHAEREVRATSARAAPTRARAGPGA